MKMTGKEVTAPQSRLTHAESIQMATRDALPEIELPIKDDGNKRDFINRVGKKRAGCAWLLECAVPSGGD